MLTRGIGLRAEYVFADFGEERFRVETGTPTDVDLTSHTFRAALVFRETEGSGPQGALLPGPSGFYAGVMGGYGVGNADLRLPRGFDASYTPSGGSFGLFSGYDYSFGRVFAGIGITGFWTGLGDIGGGGPNRISGELLWSADARARLGVTFGNLSPFITGGFSLAQIDIKRFDAIAPGLDSQDLSMHYGYTVGAGADWALSERLFARGEYAYTAYTPARANVDAGRFARNHLDRHEFRLGIAYRLTD
jgi:outer membrane immunogenic protein